ncbi:MAG: UvrB/UvrC motif-containing protein [Gemmatimonadota bacterium]
MPTVTESPLTPLREKVRAGVLNRPGVYRMTGGNGVVIYVGKSKRLRTRLLGYFRAKREEKAWRIVREANAIDWEYSPSEFASLLRELQLIKRLRPPYNVRQKRDGIFSFLKLSAAPAPRLNVVRRPGDEPATYFGPFRGGQRIREAVKELNDVLLLRDCRRSTPINFADQADLFAVELTPLCARFELRRCAAPCAARCTEREYEARVRQATAFLQGDADGPLRELESRMEAAAGRMEFEHAASLRDRIQRLEMLRSEFLRLRGTIEQLSFLYVLPGFEAEHRVYAIRSGSIRQVYDAPRTAAERRRLLRDAEKHYRDPEPTGEIASPQRIDEMLLVAHWFRTRPAELESAYREADWTRLPLTKRLDRMALA